MLPSEISVLLLIESSVLFCGCDFRFGSLLIAKDNKAKLSKSDHSHQNALNYARCVPCLYVHMRLLCVLK